MREREVRTAKHFGILEKMQEFEKKLLTIDGISEVDFDLDGFWSDIFYVILIPKYSIPVHAEDYYKRRKHQLQEIITVCEEFDLSESGDVIEDYGEHWYIVRKCGRSWNK